MSEFLLIDQCNDSAPPEEATPFIASGDPAPISGMTRRLRDRAGQRGRGRLDAATVAALRSSVATGATLEQVAPISLATSTGADSGAARSSTLPTVAFLTLLFLALRAA